MAFAKSSSSAGNPSVFGHVKWAMKDKTIPTPNIEFYHPETKSNSYLLNPGDADGVQIDGVIKHVTAFSRVGFNDRDKNVRDENGDLVENEWRLMVVVNDGVSGVDDCVTMDLISDVGEPDSRTMSFLNTLNAHLEQGGKDQYVRLSLYTNKNGYASSALIRASSDEEGNILRDDEGNVQFDYKTGLVKAAEFAPRSTPKLDSNGKQLEYQGFKLFDHDNVNEWAQETMAAVAAYFPTKAQTQEEGADPAEGMDDGEGDAPARPRQSA